MNRLKKIVVGLSSVLLVAVSLIALFPLTAYAQTPGDYGIEIVDGDIVLDDYTVEFLDAATLQLSFPEGDPIILRSPNGVFDRTHGRYDTGNNYNIEFHGQAFGCYAWFGFDVNEDDAASGRHESVQTRLLESGRLDIDFRPTASAECEDYNGGEIDDITVGSPSLSTAYFVWVDSGTIATADGEAPGTFTRSPDDSNVFLRDSEEGRSCRDKLIVSGNNLRYYELDDDYGGDPPDDAGAGDCGHNESGRPLSDVEWPIGRTENSSLEAGTGLGPGGGEEDDSCEAVGGIGWIICPVILATDGALNWLDTQIQGLLAVDENKYKNDQLYESWKSIRNIAYIVLVPIMLVMVIGTAIGIEVFSAYTVRRALPRMVAAIIFITLSWYITTFLIDFFNAVGSGILGLLTSPFRFENEPVSTLSLADLFSASGGSFFGTILAQGVITLAIAVVIWLFLAPLALIILTAFLILFLRQMFIIALSLLAPLAILSWIFPGNDKLWKLWWGSFSKLLMMYPLIMAVIAVGRIFAALIAGPGNDGGADDWFLAPFFTLAAYILPYAFIPFAFKTAGGMFANLTGMVQNGEKGVFGKMKENRAAKRERAKNEGIFRGGNDSNWRGKLNNAYRRGSNYKEGGLSMTKRGRSRWEDNKQKRLEGTSDELLKSGAAGRAYNDDDAAKLAAQEGMTRTKFVQAYAEQLKADGRGKNDADRIKMANDALNRTENATGYKIGSKQMAASAMKFRLSATNTAYASGEAGLTEMQNEIKRGIDAGHFTAVDAAGWMKANRGRSDYSSNSFSSTVAFAAGDISAADQIRGASMGADPREKLLGHQKAVETFAEDAKQTATRTSSNQAAFDRAVSSGSRTVSLESVNKNGQLVTEEVEIDSPDKQATVKSRLRGESDVAAADMKNVWQMLSNVSQRKANAWAAGKPGEPGAMEMEVTYQYKQPKTEMVTESVEVDTGVQDPSAADGTTLKRTEVRQVEKPVVDAQGKQVYEFVTKKGTGRAFVDDTRHRVLASDGSDSAYINRNLEYGQIMTEEDMARRSARNGDTGGVEEDAARRAARMEEEAREREEEARRG